MLSGTAVGTARSRGERWLPAIGVAVLLAGAAAYADVTDSPKPKIRYMDSDIGGAAEGHRAADADPDLTPEQKELLKKILAGAPVTTGIFAALRDAECPMVKTHYIDGNDQVVQFAEDAAAGNGDCTMSLYLGHGRGSERDGVNRSVVDRVADAFRVLNLSTDTATSVSPKFGFWSCWAKNYNDTVHEFYRTSFSWTNDGISDVKSLTEHLASQKDAINTELAILCEECRGKVTLHLYFGAMEGPREGLTNSNGFSTWK